MRPTVNPLVVSGKLNVTEKAKEKIQKQNKKKNKNAKKSGQKN